MQNIDKRCGNCGKYPFCKETDGAGGYCENWIRKLNKEATNEQRGFKKL